MKTQKPQEIRQIKAVSCLLFYGECIIISNEHTVKIDGGTSLFKFNNGTLLHVQAVMFYL